MNHAITHRSGKSDAMFLQLLGEELVSKKYLQHPQWEPVILTRTHTHTHTHIYIYI